jgi:cytochrome c-type biogenesis protein CcmH
VEEQVLRYFERSYGEFVRLRPPLRGVNWIVWLAPIVGLLLGAAIVSRLLRRRRAPEAPGEPAPGADTDLEPYLRRVREAAYGWPGGVRPGKPAA